MDSKNTQNLKLSNSAAVEEANHSSDSTTRPLLQTATELQSQKDISESSGKTADSPILLVKLHPASTTIAHQKTSNKCNATNSRGKPDCFGSNCSSWSQQTSSASVKVSYELTPFSSTQSSLFPVCRICHLPHEKSNVLISPCRCNGSVKHVHGTCLRVSMFSTSGSGLVSSPSSSLLLWKLE